MAETHQDRDDSEPVSNLPFEPVKSVGPGRAQSSMPGSYGQGMADGRGRHECGVNRGRTCVALPSASTQGR